MRGFGPYYRNIKIPVEILNCYSLVRSSPGWKPGIISQSTGLGLLELGLGLLVITIRVSAWLGSGSTHGLGSGFMLGQGPRMAWVKGPRMA